MSYSFPGTSATLGGTLGTSLTLTDAGLTIGAWIKIATPEVFVADAGIAAVHNGTVMTACIKATAVHDTWKAETYDGDVTARSAVRTVELVDQGWTPIVAVYQANGTNRQIYIDGVAGTDDFAGQASGLSQALTTLKVGDDGRALGNWFAGKIAAVAVWNSPLSDTDRGYFEAGTTYPGDISPDTLRCYFSLFSGNTRTDGADSITTLTVTNATLDTEDNPPVSEGLVKYLKFIVHPVAVGQTVQGVVFESPTASPETTDIVGAKVGEFTGASVTAGTGDDTGKGVVLVDVADFGGGLLQTDDTVVALLRNATDTTGLESGVIVEI